MGDTILKEVWEVEEGGRECLRPGGGGWEERGREWRCSGEERSGVASAKINTERISDMST